MNLNTVLILASLTVASITIGRFAGPIFSTPERIAGIEHQQGETSAKLSQINTVQAVQSDALKKLAEIAVESNSASRATDRLTVELAEIRRRLERLETR